MPRMHHGSLRPLSYVRGCGPVFRFWPRCRAGRRLRLKTKPSGFESQVDTEIAEAPRIGNGAGGGVAEGWVRVCSRQRPPANSG